MADNVTLNAGTGGATMRSLSDAAGNEWVPGVVCYATATTPGAATFQFVGTTAGLPVAQQGTWNVGVTGSVAVTGTFWQATQPVSGTVTANAGTGTFTVGGTVTANQGGTWNVGTVTTVSTVSTVTAIANALPAGTNLLGQIAAGQQVGNLYNGATALTPQYATLTTSTAGAQTLVAAQAAKKIYVLRWRVIANGATNVNLQSHTTTTLATATNYLTQFASGGGAYCPAGIMATATGEALDVVNSAAVAVSVEVTYVAF